MWPAASRSSSSHSQFLPFISDSEIMREIMSLMSINIFLSNVPLPKMAIYMLVLDVDVSLVTSVVVAGLLETLQSSLHSTLIVT